MLLVFLNGIIVRKALSNFAMLKSKITGASVTVHQILIAVFEYLFRCT